MATTINTQQAGRVIHEAATARGWSQRELARVAGVSEATIRLYIAGERKDEWPFTPTRKIVRKIADAFGQPAGIRILEVFGYQDMVEQFIADHSNPVVDLTDLEQRMTRQERRLDQLIDTLGAISNRAMPDSLSSNGNVIRVPFRRPALIGRTVHQVSA